MCKATNKRINDYLRLESTNLFLLELSMSTVITVDLLVQKIMNGGNELRGTWVHPQVAINLGQWLSPKIRKKNQFKGIEEFINCCRRYSVFKEKELRTFYNKENFVVIEMLYNIALTKRIIRDDLINIVDIDSNVRWSFIELNDEQLINILKLGEVNESFNVN